MPEEGEDINKMNAEADELKKRNLKNLSAIS